MYVWKFLGLNGDERVVKTRTQNENEARHLAMVGRWGYILPKDWGDSQGRWQGLGLQLISCRGVPGL